VAVEAAVGSLRDEQEEDPLEDPAAGCAFHLPALARRAAVDVGLLDPFSTSLGRQRVLPHWPGVVAAGGWIECRHAPILSPTVPAAEKFASQVVFITGASGGIGRALIETFAAAGARLALLARSRAAELSRWLAVEGLALWRSMVGGVAGGVESWAAGLFLVLLGVYTAVLWFPASPGRQVLHGLALLAGLTLLLVNVFHYPHPWTGWLGSAMLGGNAVVSAFLLGTTLIGLLLGHRYLNEPELSVSLIKRLSDVFTGAILLQGALPAFFTILVYGFGQGTLLGAWIGLLGEHWFLLFSRMLLGIGASFVVALTILNCLRLPNVQAATGFYYVAVITVFLGEFMGRYLLASASLPF